MDFAIPIGCPEHLAALAASFLVPCNSVTRGSVCKQRQLDAVSWLAAPASGFRTRRAWCEKRTL